MDAYPPASRLLGTVWCRCRIPWWEFGAACLEANVNTHMTPRRSFPSKYGTLTSTNISLPQAVIPTDLGVAPAYFSSSRIRKLMFEDWHKAYLSSLKKVIFTLHFISSISRPLHHGARAG